MNRKKKICSDFEDERNNKDSCEVLFSPSGEQISMVKLEDHVEGIEKISTWRKLTNDDSRSSVPEVKIKEEPRSKLRSLKLALSLNAKIQDALKKQRDVIIEARKKNIEKQALLQKYLDEEQSSKRNTDKSTRIRAISVFAAPYFRDVKKMVPPFNEDAKAKRKSNDVNAYLNPPRPWHSMENKKLLDGVTAYALISALKASKRKRDYLKSKMKDKHTTEEDIIKLQIQIEEVEEDIKIISARPLTELLDNIEGNIDWRTISAVNMEGSRTAEECENMWNNFLDFTINKDAFSEVEDERLKNLADDFQERDWDLIAEHLETARTPIQCFERYQRHLNAKLKKRYWTADEDQRLIDLIEQHKIGKIIPWNKIALYMDGRTRQQVINRYERSISVLDTYKSWTLEEDAMLFGCVKRFGLHWAKMKPFFKRRKEYVLRERYVNALNPEIKYGCWTKEEDKLLITMIRKHGYGKWSKIAQQIPGRTDNMCLVRASRLLEHSIKFHSDNGVEYEIDVYDPELFAKILKPLAPTKSVMKRTTEMRTERDAATQMFFEVLKKVVPAFSSVESVESVDFTALSNEAFNQISAELHRILDERLKKGEVRSQVPRYVVGSRRLRKRKYEPESDDDSGDELCQESSPVKNISEKDKEWLDQALANKLEMAIKVMRPRGRKRVIDYNNREHAEISLYKAYLYKHFQCAAVCDEGDDISNVRFNDVDFAETLQTVVSFFVQPPVYNNEFMVLAPNLNTIGGMEVIEATESQLESMSELVRYSNSYMDYLFEKKESCPMCLQCLYTKNAEINTKVSPEIMISDLDGKHFVVDERLNKAAHVESASLEKCKDSCACTELERSREAVRLLRMRFMSMFMWPALLSCTKLSEDQESLVCSSPPRIAGDYFKRFANTQPRKLAKKTSRVVIPIRMKDQKKLKRRWNRVVPTSDVPTKSEAVLDIHAPGPSHAPDQLPSLIKSDSDTNTSVPASGSNSNHTVKETKVPKPKPAKKTPKNVLPDGELRRSRRSCVVNKASFSYTEKIGIGY